MQDVVHATREQALGHLQEGVSQMLSTGVAKADILSMFHTLVNQQASLPSATDGYDEKTVFTELPEGLIDSSTASKKYQLNSWTLRDWVKSGCLVLKGRLKASAPGGGYCVVEEAALVDYMATPPRRGRPPKGVSQMLSTGVAKADILSMFHTLVNQQDPVSSDSVAPNGFDENTVFTELPEGLVDVPTASKKYAVNTAYLRDLLRRGRLQLHGRLKASAPGGGYLVLSEQQLIDYLAMPKSKGGRPKKTIHYC